MRSFIVGMLGCLMVLCHPASGEEELTLTNAPPVVVKTFPEAGQVSVDPNTREITVQFSKEMTDGNWSWSTAGGKAKFPETTDKPRFDDSKRVCTLPVKLEPGKEYCIGINWGKFNSFMDKEGRRSIAYLLVFKTADR